MRKTTWNDYYERNVEKRDFSLIADISEECGKSRWIIECPFCGDKVTLYKWHPEKRCDSGTDEESVIQCKIPEIVRSPGFLFSGSVLRRRWQHRRRLLRHFGTGSEERQRFSQKSGTDGDFSAGRFRSLPWIRGACRREPDNLHTWHKAHEPCPASHRR